VGFFTEAVESSPLDKLPVEQQLVSTMLKRQGKPVPASAEADIAALAAMFEDLAAAARAGGCRPNAPWNHFLPSRSSPCRTRSRQGTLPVLAPVIRRHRSPLQKRGPTVRAR
jgi:hypothetical protein